MKAAQTPRKTSRKWRRKSITGRRRKCAGVKIGSQLLDDFDNEACSQTDVGSTSIGSQTEVESAAGKVEGEDDI